MDTKKLTTLQKQKRKLENKIDHEKIIRVQFSELSLKILELAQEHGQITISSITKLTQANRNTIKKRIAELVLAKHIIQSGKGKGTWYSLG